MAYPPELRREIMGDITKHLSLQDYVRFGAIHSSWSARAKANYHSSHHRYPLLIVNDYNLGGNPRLYNIFNQSFYPLDLPPGYHCCGSSRGWLLMMNSSRKMCLFNPFSKTRIDLPLFLLSEREYRGYKRVGEQMDRPLHEIFLERLIFRAVLSADPEKCSDYIIMVISRGASDLRFWRSGDSSWTRIRDRTRDFLDVVWYNGAFHALSMFNEVFVVCLSPNLKLKRIARKPNSLHTISRYLVDCMGDLLIVERKTTEKYAMHTSTHAFLVFKLDEKDMKFTKVESIGNHALFLGRNSTIAIPTGQVL
ncbi:F-box protein At2g26160-like [Dioscorea cayenensis subsp. rotundata]|uniref:F-box protein At2g26160-like n=1 Tax=Dioscorea cayennensis subsp. rotundata TaxID=55577 RepID=A0AB40AL77_DIOCR|nr:F-box protein At2g26160-like [Dioscorea cayenensis subsp. rotundata]